MSDVITTEIVREGETVVLKLTAAIDGGAPHSHQVVMHETSKPDPDGLSFGEMSDVQVVAAEQRTIDEWLAGLKAQAAA